MRLSSLKESSRKSRVSIHALLAECDGGCSSSAPGGIRFQSTHSLRSATGPTPTAFPASGVSIHALLAECDPMSEDIYFRHGVSIHALLAECDHFSVRRGRNNHGFNPRTPCGVRPIMRGQADMPILFQSTHSLRSATCAAGSPAP